MTFISAVIPVDRFGQIFLVARPGEKPGLIQVSEETDAEQILAGYGISYGEIQTIYEGASSCGVKVKVYLANKAENITRHDDVLPPVLLPNAVKMINEGTIDDLVSVAGILRAFAGKLVEEKLPILYQDAYCVAVYKPSGMLVHRTNMDQEKETLQLLLRNQLNVKVQPVHRLDKPTSGIVLFVTDETAIKPFFELFQQREVRKTYWTMVRGFTDDSGVIDHDMVRNKDSDKLVSAITEYETLARTELPIPVGPYATSRYSLVKVNLKTGRMHQIRKHFAHISHPVVGDTKYGDGRHNRMLRENFRCHRLMLAAVGLEFTHPITGEEVKISADVDASFRDVMDKTGLHADLH